MLAFYCLFHFHAKNVENFKFWTENGERESESEKERGRQ